LHYPTAVLTTLMFTAVALILVMIAGVDFGAKREARVAAPQPEA
jgi:hypothetical protein